jgi:hypothetical protein
MTRKTENRQKTGKRGGRRRTTWEPGVPSPNKDGRPKKDFDLVTRCRELTPAIIEHYGQMGANAITGADVMAGKVVVEYGNDKPRQRTEITGKGGGPIQFADEKLTREEMKREISRLEAEAAAAEAEEGGDEPDEPPDGEEG